MYSVSAFIISSVATPAVVVDGDTSAVPGLKELAAVADVHVVEFLREVPAGRIEHHPAGSP